MRIFGLVLIYLVFIAIIGPILLIYNLQATVLSSSEIIKNSFAKADAYNRISSLSSNELEEFVQSETRDPDSQISPSQLQQILASIPPETIQKTAEQGIDSYFEALKNNRSNFGIDITEIKQKTFARVPIELVAEIDKSVPNTYNVQLTKKYSALKFLFNPKIKFYSLAALAFLMILSLLLGKGWKGKLRALGGLIFSAGVVASISYILIQNIPISKLANIIADASSQKLMLLFNDVLMQMAAPIIAMYRNEWVYTFAATIFLFLLTFIIPGRRAMATNNSPATAIPVAPAPMAPTPANPLENIAAKSDK